MQKIIPIFYSEYGRYIARFRAIPLYIDALKPVERRILLGLNDVAKNKPVKSAKVIGHIIGSYHPHGDQSAYQTMADMVRRGLALGEGNWGSSGIEDDPPAAMRYTEVRSQPWVDQMAFAYCKPEFIPWEDLELDPEPVYLPAPLPIGLIGSGVITGIAFYTTTIPRYTSKDLAKRLIWLLEETVGEISTFNIDEIDCNEKQFGPLIKPNIPNCDTFEIEKNAYYKLLLRGYGSLKVSPKMEIDEKRKMISIKGKAPIRNGFSILTRKCDGLDAKGKPMKTGKIDANLKDLSKTDIDIALYPERPRTQDLNQLASEIWEVISPNINFNCQFCDQKGQLYQMGIDKILLASYSHWKQAVLNKKVFDALKLYDKYYESYIIHYIRQMDLNGITTVDDVVSSFTKGGTVPPVECEEFITSSKKWTTVKRPITEKNVREVCSKKSIKQLIEVAIDFGKITTDIKETKQSIIDNDKDCLSSVKTLL
jgi:DNA gyrase/topoisomerase IV subunit A